MHAKGFLTRCLSSAIAVILIVISVFVIRHHTAKSSTPVPDRGLGNNSRIELMSYQPGGALEPERGRRLDQFRSDLAD